MTLNIPLLALASYLSTDPDFQPMHALFSTPIDHFLAMLLASHLVRADTLQQSLAEVHIDRYRGDALDTLIAHLIESGTIAKWQSDMLRKGRFRGFFMDGFRLLAEIRRDDRSVTYSAKELSSGDIVAIQVMPPDIAPRKNGVPQYSVVERSTA
jgi:hypothetical protein